MSTRIRMLKAKISLYFGAGRTHGENTHIGTCKGFQHTENNAAQQCPCHVADTPQDSGGEGFQAGKNPTNGSIRVNFRAYKTPAAPPSIPPTRKVSEMIRLTSIPIRLSVG